MKGDLSKYSITIFPRIVSAETILFLNLVLFTVTFGPLVTGHKSAETIQGWKLFAELQYFISLFKFEM